MSLKWKEITPELIKQWKKCSPEAWQKVWIDSLLYESFRATGVRSASYWYDHYRWLNPRLYLDDTDIEACALGALNQVQLEFKNSDEEFNDIFAMVNRFYSQYEFRIRDYIKELLLPTGKGIVQTENRDEQNDEPDKKPKRTRAFHLSEFDTTPLPEPVSGEEEVTELASENEVRSVALQLIARLETSVVESKPATKHLNCLKAIFLTKKHKFEELMQFINFLRRSGEHHPDVTLRMIQTCCRNNNTYYTHKKRLQECLNIFWESETARQILMKIEGFDEKKHRF